MKIEIIEVKVENKGKYNVANVTYKAGADGKVDAKKVMSFINKDVYKVLATAQLGDIFEVKSEKNDKGYWEWKEISSEGKNTSPASKQNTVASRGFETTEERAKRQVYIVRQSSITAALELFKVNGVKKPITTSDVVSVAKEFEAYVFDTTLPKVDGSFKIDIPPADVA